MVISYNSLNLFSWKKSAFLMTQMIHSYSTISTEMQDLDVRLTNPSTTQKPTAVLLPTRLTASDMFLPYQQDSFRPTYSSPSTKRFCAQGMFFYDVKLRDGWDAGMLLQAARVDNMAGCLELCCDEPACDLVMLKKKKCYTVRCKGGDTCTVEEGGEYQISFVSRQGEIHCSSLNS